MAEETPRGMAGAYLVASGGSKIVAEAGEPIFLASPERRKE